jgi:hypothetical protein
MENAEHRVAYETGFVRFIDSLEEYWTSFFDEGKKSFTAFQPWAGKYVKLRKDDELLRYLYQARHKSQHQRFRIDWGPASIQVAPGYFGTIRDLKVMQDGTFEVDAHPTSDKEANKVTLKQNYGDPKLPDFENRGVIYEAPTTYWGKPLKSTVPHEVAKCGSDFYASTLLNAVERFSNDDT